MSEWVDTILQTRPALRLILFSLLLAAAVSAMASTRWKSLPRCRSFALTGTLAVLFAAPLLTILSLESGITWRVPIAARMADAPAPPEPVPFPMPLFESAEARADIAIDAEAPNHAAVETSPAPFARLNYAIEWFIELWLIGSLLLLLRLPLAFFQLRRVLTHTRLPNTDEQARLARLIPGNQKHGSPTIRISPLEIVPFFTGLFRSCIVIPHRLLTKYSDEQLRMVIEHEQAHARHRDQWIALLQELTIALNWWNPLVWKLSRQLTVTREMLCDHAVTDAKPPAFRERYRELLVTMTETFSQRAPTRWALALAATSCFKNLRERLLWLNNITSTVDRRPSPALVTAMALLAIGALLISSCDNSPKAHAEPVELSELDRKIQNGEITFDSFFSELTLPEIDPAMATPGRDTYITSKFVETSSASALEPAVKVERSFNEPQIYITSKFVETENEIDRNLPTYAILTEPQYQLLMRMLNMERGADLMSAPSVMTRNAQTAKIEVTRRLPLPASPDFDTHDAQPTPEAFVDSGVTLEITPTIKHGKIFLVGKATIRTPDSPTPENQAPTVQGVMSFNTVETYFSAPIEHGATLLLNCRQTDRQNGSLLIAVTAAAKDQAGNDRPLK